MLAATNNTNQSKQWSRSTRHPSFFTGDHPALQFERGTQQGGKYKCGSCGCVDAMFEDQAHSLNYHWRRVEELQIIATVGKYGKTPGAIKPFQNLRVDEIQTELIARKFYDFENKKNDMQQSCFEEYVFQLCYC